MIAKINPIRRIGIPIIGKKKHKHIPTINKKHPTNCLEFCSLTTLTLLGFPQLGQNLASVESCLPQSSQFINGILPPFIYNWQERAPCKIDLFSFIRNIERAIII